MKPTSPNQLLQDIHASLERDCLSEAHKFFLRETLDRYLSNNTRYDLTRALGLPPIRRGRSERKQRVLGEPRWVKSGVISDTGIGQLIFEVNAGDSHPDDIFAALVAIHAALHGHRELTRRMLGYLAAAIGRYLQGKVTVEQAFGLKRSAKGRPGLPVNRQQEIAGFVLIQCFRSSNRFGLRGAATIVGKEHGIGATQVLEYWRKHKGEAIHLAQRQLSNKRLGLDEGVTRKWTARERKIILDLFARDNAKIGRL